MCVDVDVFWDVFFVGVDCVKFCKFFVRFNDRSVEIDRVAFVARVVFIVFFLFLIFCVCVFDDVEFSDGLL